MSALAQFLLISVTLHVLQQGSLVIFPGIKFHKIIAIAVSNVLFNLQFDIVVYCMNCEAPAIEYYLLVGCCVVCLLS